MLDSRHLGLEWLFLLGLVSQFVLVDECLLLHWVSSVSFQSAYGCVLSILMACLAIVLTGNAYLFWKLGCKKFFWEGCQENMASRIHKRQWLGCRETTADALLQCWGLSLGEQKAGNSSEGSPTQSSGKLDQWLNCFFLSWGMGHKDKGAEEVVSETLRRFGVGAVAGRVGLLGKTQRLENVCNSLPGLLEGMACWILKIFRKFIF